MGSKGGFALLGLLLILSVLCRSGQSLKCYHCDRIVQQCFDVTTCGDNYDTCMSVEAAEGRHRYFKCWRRKECKYSEISRILGESQLRYMCCQDDLCNKDLPPNDAPATSGKTLLLLVPLLAAAWNVCF